MRQKRTVITALVGLAMATLNTGQAQVQNNVFGQYRLTPGSPTPQSFAIGNNYTLGYALDVHGEQMNPPLGDVFKTDGPDDKDTYWRMFRGGKEYGNIFNLTAKNDWNLNATTGYMKFHTNSLERMRLSPTLTGQTINGYTGLDLSGFLCIGQYSGASNSVQQAYTLLHLNEFGINPGGYRPWMRVGMLATRGSDMSYFGLRTDPQGATNNTVVAWCDNPLGEIGADALQFVFSAHPTGGTGIAGTLSGLEAGRFISAVGGDEAYFGLGDYYTAGINPTQRLDLLNGKVRIRKLPDDPAATEPYKIMVVDDSPGNSINRGIVKWIDPTSLVSGCEWELNPGTQNNVSTAYSNVLSTSCPDVTDAVGIGVDLGSSAAIAKLKVKNTSSVATMTDGIQVAVSKAGVANGMLINASSSSKPVTGINVTVNGSGTGADGVAIGARLVVTGSMGGASTRGAQVITNGTCTVARAGEFISNDVTPSMGGFAMGVIGEVHSGLGLSAGTTGRSYTTGWSNFGVLGEARGIGNINVGVYASQNTGSFITPPSGNIGVFATTLNQDTTISTNWAGYFRGNVMVTGAGVIPGGVWSPSDENLKENITDLPNGLEVITQLNPKSYDYQADALPQVGLPAGQQYGFLAQELEQVIPEAVKDITYQTQLDSVGQVVYPAVSSKIVNTATVIPFLVAAVKEQQATIDQQNTRMAELEDRINQCCAANGNGMAPQNGERSTSAESNVQEQRLLIIPNPVADLTTLEYYVPKAGQVSLQVSTNDGKPVEVLREEKAEAGAYNYAWNTTKLAAGTYFCTFMLDGAVVVKRAVKVK